MMPALCLQRPARSQISTAVSFEPAHPANSAANAARSGEDSAASAAEPEGEASPESDCQCMECPVVMDIRFPRHPYATFCHSSTVHEVLKCCQHSCTMRERHVTGLATHIPLRAGELSSLPQEPLEGPGQQRQSRVPLAYPSGSLISTAMRPTAHTTSQPHSPPAERATSVVSKTALRRSPEAVRAGTPASVYAQDRAPGRRPLNISPHDSQALEQVTSTRDRCT